MDTMFWSARQSAEWKTKVGLAEMLNFYKCYRAYVRGKISLFTAGDPAVDPAVKAACLANGGKYFALAQGYARG